MLKKLTKVLSLLLILCLMVSMFPAVALADEGTEAPVVTETPEETTPVVTPVPEESSAPVESPVPSETPAVEASPAPSDTPVDNTSAAGDEPAADDEPASDEPGDFAFSNKTDAEDGIDPLASSNTISYPEKTRSVSLTGDFRKIVMVDAGRKYFTADWIIALINEMAADGYTTLCLAVGNDGLRFLLNDMSVTVGDTTYSSADVTAAIKAGNKTYHDFGTNELTQSEMDKIFVAAGHADIEIIPLINTPGHMDAILSAATRLTGTTCSYNGSRTTIDVTNATAVNFTYALLEKYVAYFAANGCKAFNIGCDEYANDVYTTGGMGFGNLQSTEKYASFVKYVNGAAALVQNHGLAPICFNDGIYYNNVKTTTIDSALTICYWSSGWSGYTVRSAANLSTDGFKLINTHGDFYYVLGKSDKFDSGYSYASNWSNTTFPGSSGVTNKTGSMFCIWCDFPSAESETEIAQKVRLPLRAMAAAMADNDATAIDTETVVSGGFNADGSLNVVVVETVTKTDETTGISVTAPGLTGLNVALREAASYPGTASLTVGYDITPVDVSGNYDGDATVTVPVPAEMTDTSRISVWDVKESKTIRSTVAGGYITFTVTHFSEYDIVYNAEEPENIYKTINLVYGESSQTEIIANEYLVEAVDERLLNKNIASVKVDGTEEVPETVTYTQETVTCDTLLSSNTDQWTAASGYYYQADDGNYYPLFVKRSSSYSYNKGTTYNYTYGYSTGNEIAECGTQNYTIRIWDSHPNVNILLYTKSGTTEATPASTTITFTPVGAGTTYVTVGSYTYKIVVAKAQATKNVVIGNNTTIELSGAYEITGNDGFAECSVAGTTMTITGVAVGTFTVTDANTIYTVNVINEDLSTVTPLEVEYWITNQKVSANSANSMTIEATVDGVHSENGKLFSKLVPKEGTQGGNTMVFWKGTVHTFDSTDSKDYGHQDETGGNDRTLKGNDFTYIRYWNGAWAYSSDGATWTDIDLSYNSSTKNNKNDQVVAYYLQKTDVTNEVTTYVVDWGPQKGNWSDLNYLGTKYVLVDYSVKYETGEEYPSSFPTSNSLAFHCDTSTTNSGYYYRTLGMVRAEETDEFEVYMITVTPSDDSPASKLASTAASNTSYSYNGTELVAWAATQGDLDNSGLGTYTSISGTYTYSIGGDPIVSGLEIYRQQGMKVTFYVRAKQTEDSLSVHYIDQTTNSEFYSYNIAVKSGTLFNENIGLTDPWKGNLANGSVTNNLGKTQTVSADLSTMPAIGAQYRYSDYTCVKVERSEDGKEVYLYYTFNNAHSFVIDFGLPLKITTSDLGISGDWTSASVSGAQYGTATATVGAGVTYTPSQTLKGVETLQLTLTDSTGSVTHQIYIYPATTVYYEEGFASGSWTGGSKGRVPQSTEVPGGKQNNYGYDGKYAVEAVGPSNGTEAVSSAIGEDAVFTFTGTGVDIYANCTTATGAVSILIKNSSSNAIVKLLQVNTATGAAGSATTGQNVDSYSLPIASVTDLSHGTYTVTIRHSKTNADDANSKVYLDGFRVYGTLADQSNSIYTADLEDNPTYIELRDRVLKALSVTTANSQYASDIAEYTLAQVYATGQTTEGAVVISNNTSYTSDDVQDLLDNGPKNEIFLRQNECLVFNVTTNREVQIGLKAVDSAVTCTVNGQTKNISSSTDMFYPVLSSVSGDAREQTITITNNSGGILSITKLKICDDPGATLGELTQEDLIPALVGMGYELDPEEPVVEYADATLTVVVNDATTTLTKNGVVGESATFTAEEIEAAAQSLVPEGYELKGQAEAVTVVYGESDTVTFSAEEIPTEPEEPEEPEQPTDPEEPEQPSKPANIISAVIRLFDKIFGSLKGLFR